MGFEVVEVGLVERLDRGVLDGAVHLFGLTVGPRVIGFGELVRDAMLFADAVEDVAAEHGFHGEVVAAVFRQAGEGHAVVGQYGVDGVWERAHHTPREISTVHLACVISELDVGEFGHAVDGQEYVELALSSGAAR